VTHRDGSYPVMVGTGIGDRVHAIIESLHPGARVAVISDRTVAALLPGPLPGVAMFTFPAGEEHKTRDTWAALTDELLGARFDRNTVIVAFGGGVTTDLAGFVAATYLRGVPWLACPTTTLGMIDASIGGKTGVDTSAGKNLVGAFHPPDAVVADLDTLATLPAAAFREGIAEAVKHAAILDARYGEWMEQNAARIVARSPDAVEHLVARSAELKAEVVSGDEREGGRRSILNAGHTVAHALERATGYAITHGDAVAIGLVAETRIAERMGACEAGSANRIAALLDLFGLPTEMPERMDRDAVIGAMHHDKKNRTAAVHAAFITAFGEVGPDRQRWTTPFDPAMLP
jgi:3-dehydroquinate synthase